MSEVKRIDDPTLKPGDSIELAGIPIRIASDEEIEKESLEGNMVVVCMPCRFGPALVPGATVGMCGDCRCDVWVSPATKASMPDEATIRCLECVQKVLDEEE